MTLKSKKTIRAGHQIIDHLRAENRTIRCWTIKKSKALSERKPVTIWRIGGGFTISLALSPASISQRVLGKKVWLAYRKLYVPLFWLAVVAVTDVSLTLYAEDNQLVPAELIASWDWLAVFLYFSVIGTFGNYWYWKKFQKVEAQAESQHPDREMQLRFIRSKGGTNSIGAWLVVLVLLVPVAWVVYQANRTVYSDADAARLDIVLDATGPLTLAEVRINFIDRMDERLNEERRERVLREVEERARAAGDPEALDPATVELLPAERWNQLDTFGKRVILARVITTKTFFVCK